MLVLSAVEVCFGTWSCSLQFVRHTNLKSLLRSSSALRLLHWSTLFSITVPQKVDLKFLTVPAAHLQFSSDCFWTQFLKRWLKQPTVCFSFSYWIFYLRTKDNLHHSFQGLKFWDENSYCRFMIFWCWAWNCFQWISICFKIWILIFRSWCDRFCPHSVLIEKLVIS